MTRGTRITYVKPRCEEIHFRRQRPISNNLCEGSGFIHSSSRSYGSQYTSAQMPSEGSCKHESINPIHARQCATPARFQQGANGRTSISNSSSIFMTFPNMAMYCIRLANSQLLLMRWSRPGSSGVCCSVAATASERLRFRDPIAAERGRSGRGGVRGIGKGGNWLEVSQLHCEWAKVKIRSDLTSSGKGGKRVLFFFVSRGDGDDLSEGRVGGQIT